MARPHGDVAPLVIVLEGDLLPGAYICTFCCEARGRLRETMSKCRRTRLPTNERFLGQ